MGKRERKRRGTRLRAHRRREVTVAAGISSRRRRRWSARGSGEFRLWLVLLAVVPHVVEVMMQEQGRWGRGQQGCVPRAEDAGAPVDAARLLVAALGRCR